MKRVDLSTRILVTGAAALVRDLPGEPGALARREAEAEVSHV